MLNGFKLQHEKLDDSEEIVSKLEEPSGGYRHQSYTVTQNGVHLSKGEEIGMFHMGSTIAMILETPENY